MTTIHLLITPGGVLLSANLKADASIGADSYFDVVQPGEYYGGYSYDELLHIAQTRGEMDADELRV